VDGHLFVARGDITQLAAHAIAYSTSTGLGAYGALYPAFRDHSATARRRGRRIPSRLSGYARYLTRGVAWAFLAINPRLRAIFRRSR
jgi:hypothetical protein